MPGNPVFTRRGMISIGAASLVLVAGVVVVSVRALGGGSDDVPESATSSSTTSVPSDEGSDATAAPLESLSVDDKTGLLDVVVTFDDGVDVDSELTALEPASVRHVYGEVLHGAAITITKKTLEKLKTATNVARVERDTEVYAMGQRSSGTSSWSLDRIDQSFLPLSKSFDVSATGRGVRVYMIDTAIDRSHGEFAQASIEAGRDIDPAVDLRSVDETRRRCLAHGTHVASAIVGSSLGVAPGATLVPVGVLDCEGDSAADVIAALDWIMSDVASRPITHAVVNVGLNGEFSASLNAAVDEVQASGITVVVPAGNVSVNACNFSPSGAKSAITVGATDDRDRITESSGHGPCVDLFAPGDDVVTADVLGPDAFVDIDGTSMAAAYVSGAVAVLAEGFTGTSADLVRILLESATPGGVNGLDRNTSSALLCIPSEEDLSFPPATLPPAMQNSPYGPVDLIASGGRTPFRWEVTEELVPSGMALSSDGSLSGTPRRPGTSTFTVEVANNSCGRAERPVTLKVVAELQILTSRVAGASIGASFKSTLSARGGTEPYTWTASGPLPPGLRIMKDGSIVGTPSSKGIFGLSVTVTDANGFTVTSEVSMNIGS